jgi:predicted dehydrogenase
MLGYAFMGKAHSNAFRTIAYMTWPPPLMPKLVSIAGRNEEAVRNAAERYGYEHWTTDWHDLVSDPASACSTTAGPTRCTRGRPSPLPRPASTSSARSPSAARRTRATRSGRRWRTGVKHLCAFNYRFVPAVRLARELIDAGELGEIRHFRGRYLQDWGDDRRSTLALPRRRGRARRARRPRRARGRPRALPRRRRRSVSALVKTFLPGPQVDDAIEAAVEFENGAVGTIESTRLALGRPNAFQWEINGSKGSLAFDMERLNELQVFRTATARAGSRPCSSRRRPPVLGVLVAARAHHRLGRDVRPRAPPPARAIAEDGEVAPYGATFEDGYRAAEVCDAIVRSSESGAREQIEYRSL